MYESYKEHEAQCLVQDREDDQSGSWLRLGHRLEDAGICECLWMQGQLSVFVAVRAACLLVPILTKAIDVSAR